ncbi:benzoate/H(+) symporter BenE family transporter [Rhodococcus fascians]|nr:benzoate/H(+) symporter BenE family transporter [Rhodococcus fascians]MBY4398178.1 benzoate/H(+) symporter BenE family transporter [Rhodococcus fascians]MBY4406959.1 benzoate/H(+) symporter BenE family transporter [Rhodococcus fascians]MBY4423105.1 benzoate/H(+) symporter BenE family transporter [Rhodococcus fascians]MBY4462600.1 benzoate/H(+) symporter BenE family transporter [Rhodococcus fascians]
MSRTPPRDIADSAARNTGGLLPPITAGVVSALVGFTSSFVVVLSGLTAVGANHEQAASGLLAVSVVMGLACIVLSWQTRLPITAAWSTPGAALLATTGIVDGGWPAAVGAFLVTGVLIVFTGLVPQLAALVTRIPTSLAQAMLAGVLLQLCFGPITGLAVNPNAVAPVVLTWLVALRFSPRWAAPLAFLAAAVVIGITVAAGDTTVGPADLIPRVHFTPPTFTVAGVVGIALPLYLVTMASQNVPGVAVMAGLGYQVPWRRSMVVTGAGTLLGATAGGHAINLAAISAALAAGPDAGVDRTRRWIASLTAGIVLMLLGVASASFGTLVALAPVGVIAAVAGLALLGTLAASLTAAFADPVERIPVVITFVTAASGTVIVGVSAAFWALLAGLTARLLLSKPRSAA